MSISVRDRLVQINREFYQHFAGEFDATRKRLQPGVMRLLDRLCRAGRLLDLGCGNGELWGALVETGFTGEYVGLDFSAPLVEIAVGSTLPESRASFLVRDLTGDWQAGLDGPFDCITAFAVFHHLPQPHPRHTLQACRDLLRPGGELILSNWQFMNSERWRARVQPWEAVGLAQDQVGPDDYLLDWRRGGRGLRYVHHFSENELTNLAEETGFAVRETFFSDGAEGNLGLYQTWIKVAG